VRRGTWAVTAPWFGLTGDWTDPAITNGDPRKSGCFGRSAKCPRRRGRRGGWRRGRGAKPHLNML
jgi:hypothetical protein